MTLEHPRGMPFTVINAEFPEAIVLFDQQCPELAGRGDVRFVTELRGLGGASIAKHAVVRLYARTTAIKGVAPQICRRWIEEARVWVRSTYGVSSYPRRDARKYPVIGTPLDEPEVLQVKAASGVMRFALAPHSPPLHPGDPVRVNATGSVEAAIGVPGVSPGIYIGRVVGVRHDDGGATMDVELDLGGSE